MKHDEINIPSNPDFFDVEKIYLSSVQEYEYEYEYGYNDEDNEGYLEDYDDFPEKTGSKWRNRPRRSNNKHANNFEDLDEY
ncbi:MAG: hypothetical protein ACI9IA_000566 [Enterobacterales bacterium]|jgi:hypothetical protein